LEAEGSTCHHDKVFNVTTTLWGLAPGVNTMPTPGVADLVICARIAGSELAGGGLGLISSAGPQDFRLTK
jgi:hypothetical protein